MQHSIVRPAKSVAFRARLFLVRHGDVSVLERHWKPRPVEEASRRSTYVRDIREKKGRDADHRIIT